MLYTEARKATSLIRFTLLLQSIPRQNCHRSLVHAKNTRRTVHLIFLYLPPGIANCGLLVIAGNPKCYDPKRH